MKIVLLKMQGIPFKGDCPACAFDDWCHLCEVRPSAEEAVENFIVKTACHPGLLGEGWKSPHSFAEDNRMAYRVKAHASGGIHGKRHKVFYQL